MVTSTSRPAEVESARLKQTIAALRIRFLPEAPPGASVRRTFGDPRPMAAVEETVELVDFPPPSAAAEANDQCWIIFVPPGANKEWEAKADHWLVSSAETEAIVPIVIEREGTTIRWCPGRALIHAEAESRDDVLAALIDFIFYEAEFRRLESAVRAREAQAQADTAFAHRIRRSNRKHWKRFGDTIEYLTQLRLTFARLEPQLSKPSRMLSSDGRRVMARLLSKADAAHRLEAVSDRLETLEDLYEGANDRVADYRWYHNGHLLEVGIILLLLIECVLVSCELVLHYNENTKIDAAIAKDQSDEFRATITKVADGKIYMTMKNGTERTLPVADNVLVLKGMIDKDTDEVSANGWIPGGLQNDVFTRAADKGVRANIVTDKENKRVAEIYVLPAGKKGQ